MKHARKAVTPADLQGLRRRVECWRASREGIRTRVPEELWQAAVVVARAFGVHATSKAVGLGYYGLKDRLERAPSKALDTVDKKSDATSFVQIAMASPGSNGKDGTIVIECVGHRGDRMRVTGSGAVDVVGLAQAFWGRDP